MSEDLLLRRMVVLVSAVVYWAGVVVKAARVRRQIGRSPNVRPRGSRERWLWVGWFLVIAIWMVQPLLVGGTALPAWLRPAPALLRKPGLLAGLVLTAAGYAGTLWCYAAMGAAWRMGINRRERTALVTAGPYALVRHPIYLFQIVMLLGVLLLLPGVLSAVALALHAACVVAKASDEEAHLLTVHGQDYRDYCHRSGRLFPKWGRRRCFAD